MARKLDHAKGLYLEGIRDGNPRDAVTRYTGSRYTQHSTGVRDGVDADESQEIISHLERAIMSPNVQCRVRWDVDTFVMWDNRCTQHFATSDFYPEERRVERVTIVGDRPF